MQITVQRHRAKKKLIAFVPTMGYLHDGHLSLIRRAVKLGDVVVVSIFVNPAQFSAGEDFAAYPRDLNRDKKLAKLAGCDVLFVPRAAEIYPGDYQTYVKVEKVSRVLEGERRPEHFKGVATVVAKLFNIIQPDLAIFGQKDFQQTLVIRQMVKDLNFMVKIVVAPTVRETDGLAKSSRNIYLTPKQRQQAPVLYQSLLQARSLIHQGERDSNQLRQKIIATISEKPEAAIDYVSINDARTLEPVNTLSGIVLLSLAVWFGKARLIDNIRVKVSE